VVTAAATSINFTWKEIFVTQLMLADLTENC